MKNFFRTVAKVLGVCWMLVAAGMAVAILTQTETVGVAAGIISAIIFLAVGSLGLLPFRKNKRKITPKAKRKHNSDNEIDDMSAEEVGEWLAADSRKWGDWVERNLSGKALEAEGKVDEAITLYERNIKEKCEAPFPYTRLAVIYTKTKEYDDAIRVTKAAIAMYENTYIANEPVASFNDKKLNNFRERLKKLEEKKRKLPV